ncbi:MAG: urea ABC transporter substrate-binding protein, partial [Rubrivivax sp.]
MNKTRRSAVQSLSAIALGVVGLAVSSMATAADTIKVGILHSLSGTMAISET